MLETVLRTGRQGWQVRQLSLGPTQLYDFWVSLGPRWLCDLGLFVPSLMNSFHKYLLMTYCEPGILFLDAQDVARPK